MLGPRREEDTINDGESKQPLYVLDGYAASLGVLIWHAIYSITRTGSNGPCAARL